ncbi:MAG: hypothetical protein O3A96_12580 [Proteobacteria bacterium]|nr:hypothetical protein [Pseudomonadota bacterium]
MPVAQGTDDIAHGGRQGDGGDAAPAFTQLGHGWEVEHQQLVSVVQQVERADERREARGQGGPGRALDPHGRNRPEAEDQNRIQDDIDDRGDDHDGAGKDGIACCAQDVVGDHGHDQQHDARIPDPHIDDDMLHLGRPRAEQTEQRFNGKHAQGGEAADDQDRQDQAVRRQAPDLALVARSDRARDDGTGPRAQAHPDAGHAEHDREGETESGQFVRAQLGDEIGIGHADRQDRQDADDHGEGHAREMPGHRAGRHVAVAFLGVPRPGHAPPAVMVARPG